MEMIIRHKVASVMLHHHSERLLFVSKWLRWSLKTCKV